MVFGLTPKKPSLVFTLEESTFIVFKYAKDIQRVEQFFNRANFEPLAKTKMEFTLLYGLWWVEHIGTFPV